MKGYILSCLIALATIPMMNSCKPERSHKASAMLARADSLLQEDLYDEAIALIDSALQDAPTESEILKQATKLRRTLRYEEAEERLIALDSALRRQDELIQRTLVGFVELHDAAYDTPIRYTHPSLDPNRLGTKPHLRAQVDTTGMLQLISVYVGGRHPQHSAISLTCSSIPDSSIRLPDIPYDDALNYRYTDGEKHWELVTYTDMMLETAVAYLEQGLGKSGRLQVNFLSGGRTVYKYSMPASEAIGLKKTIELMRLLEKRTELRREQAKYARRFVRLARRDD